MEESTSGPDDLAIHYQFSITCEWTRSMQYLVLLAAARPDSFLREIQGEIGPLYPEGSTVSELVVCSQVPASSASSGQVHVQCIESALKSTTAYQGVLNEPARSRETGKNILI